MGPHHACCAESSQVVVLNHQVSVGKGAACGKMAAPCAYLPGHNSTRQALLLAQLSCPLGVQRHQIIQGYNLQQSRALPRLWRVRQWTADGGMLRDCCLLLQTGGCATVPCV